MYKLACVFGTRETARSVLGPADRFFCFSETCREWLGINISYQPTFQKDFLQRYQRCMRFWYKMHQRCMHLWYIWFEIYQRCIRLWNTRDGQVRPSQSAEPSTLDTGKIEREKSSTSKRPARHPVSVIFFFPLQFGFRTGFVREYTTTLKKRRLRGQHWYTQDSQVRALRLSLLVCSLFVYRGTSLMRNSQPPQGPTGVLGGGCFLSARYPCRVQGLGLRSAIVVCLRQVWCGCFALECGGWSF